MKKLKGLVSLLVGISFLFSSSSLIQANQVTKSTPAEQATYQELAAKDYAGKQTIDVNDGKPNFTAEELSLQKGVWEKFGDLDNLNRATIADAMLNKCLMPKGKRGSISSVSPTGWQNKKIKGGYLYNRSHLIGWVLSGENANWKNLITGTRQLNSPEMLRYEMDLKTYLKKSEDHYVRYRVTPIYRGQELVARGVHLEGQSIGSDAIQFNVYIFNIQDGIAINYLDGTSKVSANQPTSRTKTKSTKHKKKQLIEQSSAITESTVVSSVPAPMQSTSPQTQEEIKPVETQYVDQNGNGTIKGSQSRIYHIPGSKYYERTTNPVAYFKTISEAQAAGYRAPK